MPYKPKYCCQCGEKVDRIDWKPWNSRRFCELCETEFWVYDKITWVLAGIGLAFGLFGIGIYLHKPEKQLNVAQNQFIASNTKRDAIQLNTNTQVLSGNSIQTSTQTGSNTPQTKTLTAPLSPELKSKQFEMQRIESPEKTYFCGAQTKKGTRCSRRVKSGGRCWQHEGQPAMLPQDKLIAVQ